MSQYDKLIMKAQAASLAAYEMLKFGLKDEHEIQLKKQRKALKAARELKN